MKTKKLHYNKWFSESLQKELIYSVTWTFFGDFDEI